MTVADQVPRQRPAEPRHQRSALEQIEAEIRWLSLRLRVVVERGRRRRALGPPESYRGLYVSDEEVDHLLAPDSAALPSAELASMIEEASLLRRELDAGAAGSPLDVLSRVFGLSAAERRALIVGLAPQLDSGFEKVYAYANDDVTKRHPTLELALNVLADDQAEALSLRPIFYEGAPLLRHRLLSVTDDHTSASASFLTRKLEMDDHVAESLLGDGFALDPRLHSVAHHSSANQAPQADALGLDRALIGRPEARVYLGGRWELEKEQAVHAACSAAGFDLVVVQTPVLQHERGSVLPLLFRDARLLNAGLLFLGWEDRSELDAEAQGVLHQLRELLRDHPLPVVFSGRRDTPEGMPCPMHLLLDFPQPNHAALAREWCAAQTASDDGLDTDTLAATFKLGASGIRAAISMAGSIAALRGAERVTQEDLRAAARLQSQPRLTSMAQRIVPLFSWKDIILPDDRLEQLHEIATQILHQHIVYEDWGFGSKVSLGRGVTSLFAGQSGTGKTMAAEIIARDLGLELYKIDLSSLISKYIGETEKNLSRVFDEASDSNCILFFDEADAVFGKRTEVRDSHDRYANVEVSYLLQKMEEYDGVVVLASNLRSNLDEAFLRRMKSIIEFPFPEEEDRQRIWSRMLSSSAPVSDDIDLRFMARQFRIAGGNIKNIVLLAAFLAAEDGRPIGMKHMIHATKREYQKLGRLISESDFAQWYETARS